MSEQFTRETGRLMAESEDGVVYTVVMYTKFIRFEQVAGPVQTREIGKHYELANGSPVDWVDDNSFKIVDSGKIIRKV